MTGRRLLALSTILFAITGAAYLVIPGAALGLVGIASAATSDFLIRTEGVALICAAGVIWGARTASPAGLRLVLADGVAIRPREVVDLDLTIEGRAGLSARAEVVHAARDGQDAEIGLRLLDPPAEVRRALRDVVAAAPGA